MLIIFGEQNHHNHPPLSKGSKMRRGGSTVVNDLHLPSSRMHPQFAHALVTLALLGSAPAGPLGEWWTASRCSLGVVVALLAGRAWACAISQQTLCRCGLGQRGSRFPPPCTVLHAHNHPRGQCLSSVSTGAIATPHGTDAEV